MIVFSNFWRSILYFCQQNTVCLKSPPCPNLPQLTVAVALRFKFVCQYGWQTLYHTWKYVNKEISSKPSLRPNFNTLYHFLYLRGCPQIHFVFHSFIVAFGRYLEHLSPLPRPPPHTHPSPIADSVKMLGLPLPRFVFIHHFLPSIKFEDFAIICLFMNISKVVLVSML